MLVCLVLRFAGCPCRYDPAVIDTVIFDLGNVLIPWDRFKQLRTFTSDEVEIRRLGESVITLRINERLDEGEPRGET